MSAPILIAGGGIAGLALALALARHGRASLVLEQRDTLAEEGAGIQLGPNGVRVLQRLGVAEALRPLAGEPRALRVHDGRSGKALTELPLGAWIAARHGAPYWTVHRRDLQSALHRAASAEPAVALHTGFEVTTVSESLGIEEVQAVSRGGDIATGSALVGADGLWSTVRPMICPPAAPTFAGATATRTVIPAWAAGHLAASHVGLWLAPGANVVHYPVRGGAEIAVVVIAAEAWQGREWDATADRDALAQRLDGFHGSLTEPLRANRNWSKWALYRLEPLPSWSRDRLALIGDAAHPMLPHLAQGGVMALEDAVVLADCLARRPTDEPAAFRDFEAQRCTRASRVQAASRRQGRIYHLAPPLSWARDAVLRLTPATRLMSGYDWLYGWRNEG